MVSSRSIVITFIVLIISIIFFGLSDIDLSVQDMFYNFKTKSWILSSSIEPWHFIFYSGAKKLLILIGVAFLFGFICFYNTKLLQSYKKCILIVILSAIIVPLTVGFLKKTTNMPCPKHEINYNGKMIKTAVWQKYPKPYSTMPKIKCWPAGHASGGFALLSLFFLFKSKKNKKVAIIVALLIGWAMGLYKMVIGDHFLSHTIITMILAWLIILIIAKFVDTAYLSER